MIAVYAMGGGLGHLARARKALAALGADSSDCALITASPLARGDEIIQVPRRLSGSATAFGSWLRDTLRSLAPSRILVDAFPLGILGELADRTLLPEVPVYHVARHLKWDAYRSAFPGIPRQYEASFVAEPLAPAHESYLRNHSRNLLSLELRPQTEAAQENPFANLPRPVWLLVHSGSADEVCALLRFAAAHARRARIEPQFVIVSPRALDLPAGLLQMAHANPSTLFPFADRIVTGCGFNSMLETWPWRDKHLCLPFKRRFDDQSHRALRRILASRRAPSAAP